MITTLLIDIDHKKPLPEAACDIGAHRFYTYLLSHGVTATVTARLLRQEARTQDPPEYQQTSQYKG